MNGQEFLWGFIIGGFVVYLYFVTRKAQEK